MEFTLHFLHLMLAATWLATPLLSFFCVLVVLLGQLVGRREGWSRSDALYWTFITATTVGYGDLHPSRRGSKLLSVLIAMLGLMFTGILVAITVAAATRAFAPAL